MAETAIHFDFLQSVVRLTKIIKALSVNRQPLSPIDERIFTRNMLHSKHCNKLEDGFQNHLCTLSRMRDSFAHSHTVPLRAYEEHPVSIALKHCDAYFYANLVNYHFYVWKGLQKIIYFQLEGVVIFHKLLFPELVKVLHLSMLNIN